MDEQNLIKRTLAQADSIEIIRELLANKVHAHRSAVARAVCQHFGFHDARGQMQTGGCVKALRELERAGHFVLPAVHHRGPGSQRTPRRVGEPLPAPHEVPAQAGEVRGLALVVVDEVQQMRVWNELMLCEHPQGAGPLVGAQMRYLIDSEHGYLGALGFGASALQLAARDRWIGWDALTRRAHLHRVVGMNRFLIRGAVRCHNLASCVLGMVLRRLGDDFEARYAYRPWLVESFVDTERFAGTCYRAANWVAVGHTQGRGRQDRHTQRAKTVKAIYLYALQADWRQRLGVPEPAAALTLGVGDGLDGEGWAQQEFGGASLGDRRLSERLVDSARRLALMPGRAFCAVAKGDSAAVKAHYRFIDQPDDSAVTLEAILAPHHERTVQRMRSQHSVLCIQDGTDLNYNGLAQCNGLGEIGTNQTGASSGGLHLHTTLAVSLEGLPLGLLGAQCSAPEPRPAGKASAIPIEQKKTFAWIKGLRECVELSSELPDTHLICVMDREADFFELFDEQRQRRRVDLLVRAKHNRVTSETLNLFEAVRQSPLCGERSIPVPRQSARPKKSKQKAREKREARMAQVALRYRQIELRPPPTQQDKEPISLTIVHVVEPAPPEGAKALEWFLLTTCEVSTVEQAHSCLRCYALRWRIEDWHRVLKSGCAIEDLQHQSAERLKRAIGINLVIAWRIMLMTLLGRQSLELPAEVLFSDLEIKVLNAYAKKNRIDQPNLLGNAVRIVARLGGYIGRKSDPPPGHQLMWHGYAYLRLMCDGFSLRDPEGDP
jgi:hypothetical protein